MFIKMKNRLLDLMETVSEMLGVLDRLNDPISAVSDCMAATQAMHFQLNQEEIVPDKTMSILQSIQSSLHMFLNNPMLINEESATSLNNEVQLMKRTFQDEVKGKLNVVFFPYKASMWDSLATVYEAAMNDAECVAKVVPIPYYQLSQEQAIPTYEGDRFPKSVPIIHYNDYNLENEDPDIIFVHNIYDNYNTITQVHEHYFTSNLKRYTDMLVYVPYHVSSFIPPTNGGSLAYSTPSVANVDKIILVGEYLKELAIQDGIPEEKVLALGSPKLDAMVNAMKEDISYPLEWENKVKGKKVYVINTGCLYFANNSFEKLERLVDFFNIPRFVEDSVIIWRPHPLTKISIMKYTPHLLDYYINLTEKFIKGGDELYNKIILDESDDYLPALKAADVLISTEGSLLRSYLLTEKKVLFWDENLPESSLLPSNVFYYAFNRDEPWYELVKKFSDGYDPLAQNRNGMASKVYANTDGTAGEKVYQAIKESVWK